MKLTTFFRRLLAAALVLCCTAVTAFAAQQPCIVLKASGVQNQYTLRLDAFSANFESVQFDIIIDRPVDPPQVVWRDDSPAHFQEIRTSQSDGKTTLTVYIDRLRPIANSGSVELADLTFSQAIPASAFSAGERMTALDGNQEATIYQSPALNVVERSSDGGGSGRSALSWEDVSGKVAESGGQKTLTVRVSSGETIGQDTFRQAAEEKLLLELDYGSYAWTFDTARGVTIPAGRIYYDLSVDVIDYQNLSAVVEGSDLAQLETAFSGALPCPGTLSWPVGEEYAGQTVYLSFYNENTARLEYRAAVKVQSDGTVALPLTQGGKYVISRKNVWSQSAAPAGPAQPSAPSSAAEPSSPESVPEVPVPPENQLIPPPETSAPEPASSLPPEAETDQGEGGIPGWAVPLILVLALAASGAVLYFLLQSKGSGKK